MYYKEGDWLKEEVVAILIISHTTCFLLVDLSSYHIRCFGLPRSEHQGGKMTGSHTPGSGEKRVARLELSQALPAAQNPDRVITHGDGSGRVVARHDLRPEHGALTPRC
jgi:hypothetical protein